MDDFMVVTQHYPEIPFTVPVDSEGRMTEEAGLLRRPDHRRGQQGDCQAPWMRADICWLPRSLRHQYPHCWRCKEPILFRATEQWFCSVDRFKDEAVEAVKKVKWIPGWGEERMTSDGTGACRLVYFPPAQLGRADPDLLLQEVRQVPH